MSAVEVGLASPALASGWKVYDGVATKPSAAVKVVSLDRIWRFCKVRPGGSLRFPLARSPDAPTKEHRIVWPWAREALHTVLLIGAKLILRPTARLERIPPQMWLLILELIAIDELGRAPDTNPSADVVHSLEVWSMKHALADANAEIVRLHTLAAASADRHLAHEFKIDVLQRQVEQQSLETKRVWEALAAMEPKGGD
jgi:hypothetical protein